MSKVLICNNSSCSSVGAGALVRDIEELAQGQCIVQEYGCLGKCGKGPNVEIVVNGSRVVKEGIKTFKKAYRLLEEDVGIELGTMVKKSGQEKFDIRREQDASERSKMIEKAFKTLGGDKAEKKYPDLLANLLVIRSKDLIKRQQMDALRDAKEAVRLSPAYPQALLALANAYEATRQPLESIKCLDTALEIGKGVNATAVKRQKARLERKASEETPEAKAQQPPELPASSPSGTAKDAAARQPPEGDSPGKPERMPLMLPIESVMGGSRNSSKESAANISSRSGSREVASRSGSKETPKRSGSNKKTQGIDEEKPMDAQATRDRKLAWGPSESQTIFEASTSTYQPKLSFSRFGLNSLPSYDDSEAPEYLAWVVDGMCILNHDCIELKLSCKDLSEIARQQDVAGEVFHVEILKEECGEETRRAYTPASTKDDYKNGKLVLMVKVYPEGQMSQYLNKLGLGDVVMVSRPEPTLDAGDLDDGVVMVAGGSAITVALQICLSVLRRKAGSVPVYLILCNRVAEDIVYVHILEALVEKYRNFHLVHCLSEGANRGISAGRVRWHMGRLSKSVLVPAAKLALKCVLSGPAGLLRAATDILINLGLGEQDIVALDAIAERTQPLEAMSVEELSLPQAVSEKTQLPKNMGVDSHPSVAEKASKKEGKKLQVTFRSAHSWEPDSEPKPSEPACQGGSYGFLSSWFCCSTTQRSTAHEDREGAPIEALSD